MEKNNQGSATIEITLLMPMILTIIFLLIYIIFYCYQKPEIIRTTYSAALNGSKLIYYSDNDKLACANNRYKELMKEWYGDSKDITYEINEKSNAVIVESNLEKPISKAIFLASGYDKLRLSFQIKRRVKVLKPVEYVRICRRAKGLIKNDEKVKVE